MSTVTIICWNPLCRTSVASRYKSCPKCGSPLDLRVDRELFRMLGEETTPATPFRVLVAEGRSLGSHFTVKQCWSSDAGKRDLARTLFDSTRKTASILPRTETLPGYVGGGTMVFLPGTPTEMPIPFIVQQYVEGWSLRDIGDRKAPLDEKRAAEVLRSLLEALFSLHRKGIVARVITPDCIRVDERTGKGSFVHLDYAEILDNRRLPDGACGKSHVSPPRELEKFLAPELAYGSFNFASDQFGLAASVLYACGVRRRKGESWKDALKRKSLPRLHDLLLTMLDEQPKRRFGTVEAALSYLENHCFGTANTESDDDLLDAFEGELDNTNSRRAEPVQTGGIEIDRRVNWLDRFAEKMPRTVDLLTSPGEGRSVEVQKTNYSKLLLLILLGLSLVLFMKNVGEDKEPVTDPETSAAPTSKSSSSHTVVTKLDGLVSFELPINSEIVEKEDAKGIEVVASTEEGILKFSSWSISEDATSMSEVERAKLLEAMGRKIFRRSQVTSVGPLSKTPDGYSFRDFQAEGSSGKYVTRVVLGSRGLAICMSTKSSQSASASFTFERLHFIESLRIAAR